MVIETNEPRTRLVSRDQVLHYDESAFYLKCRKLSNGTQLLLCMTFFDYFPFL